MAAEVFMRPPAAAALVMLSIVIGSGSVAQHAPRSWSVEDAPADVQPAVQRAMKAFDAVQLALSSRLLEEMKAGGPTRAVIVCRDEAQALTRQAASGSGVMLGRTSHRLRNPVNAPPAWARPFLDRAAGRRAESVEAVVVDLGDRVGVLRPIGTVGACTTCHGPRDRQPEPLQRLLAESYPKDQALGFAEGDLRGFFWAEVKR
jgi:hypothetical protein